MNELELRDIHLPEASLWWPPAPGWWISALLLLLLMLLVILLWAVQAGSGTSRCDACALHELEHVFGSGMPVARAIKRCARLI